MDFVWRAFSNAGSPFLFSGSGTFIFPGDAASFTSVTAVAGSDSTLDFNNAIAGAVDGLDQPADFITLAAAGNVVTETISPGGGRLAKTVAGGVSGTNFQHLQFDISSDADPAKGTPQLTVNAGTDLSHSTVTDILINGGVQAGAADFTGLVGNYSAHHLFVTFDSNPFNIAAGDALAPSILPGVSQVLNSFGAGELDFSNTGVGAMTVDLLNQTLSGTNSAGHAITSDQNAFTIDPSDTIISFAGVTGVIGGPGNDTIIRTMSATVCRAVAATIC